MLLVQNSMQNCYISLKITLQTRKRKAKGAKSEKSSKSSKANTITNTSADTNNGKYPGFYFFLFICKEWAYLAEACEINCFVLSPLLLPLFHMAPHRLYIVHRPSNIVL